MAFADRIETLRGIDVKTELRTLSCNINTSAQIDYGTNNKNVSLPFNSWR